MIKAEIELQKYNRHENIKKYEVSKLYEVKMIKKIEKSWEKDYILLSDSTRKTKKIEKDRKMERKHEVVLKIEMLDGKYDIHIC